MQADPMPDAPASAPLTLNVDAAARALGVSKGTVYNEMKRGTLIGRKLGTRLVFRADDLRAYVDSLPPCRLGLGKGKRAA